MACGITLAEFGNIYKCCYDCGHYIFVDRARQHSCYAKAVNVSLPGFCLASCLRLNGFGGLAMEDFAKIYHVCETCLRVFSAVHAFYHSDHCSGKRDGCTFSPQFRA